MTDKFTPGLKPEEYEIEGHPEWRVISVAFDRVNVVGKPAVMYEEGYGVNTHIWCGYFQLRDKPRKRTVWINLYWGATRLYSKMKTKHGRLEHICMEKRFVI